VAREHPRDCGEQRKGETATMTMSSVEPDLGFGSLGSMSPLLAMLYILRYGPRWIGGNSGASRCKYVVSTLVEDCQNKAAIGKYEEAMRLYAGKSVAKSWQAGNLIFGQKSDDDRPIGEIMEELRAERTA
jgi:hypothetical protein